MILILPEQLSGERIAFTSLTHPRTQQPQKYVLHKDRCWEVVRIGTENTRSAFAPGRVVSDASLATLTPVHPVFLMVKTLWANQKRAMALDLLSELSAGDATALPVELWEQYAPQVCDLNESGAAKLSLEKLWTFVESKFECITGDDLPESISIAVKRSVAPLNPSEPRDPELEKSAQKAAAAHLVASWLPQEVAEWVETELQTRDPNVLQAQKRAQNLALLREQQIAQQRASRDASSGANNGKRPLVGNGPSDKKARKGLAAPKGKYVSLTNMFKPKA